MLNSVRIAGAPRAIGLALLAGSLQALGAAPVAAQSYPNHPLRYIVPYGPGATLDIVARTMAPEMGKALGQPLIVENKPGADAIIGMEHVAKQSPADGYTVTIAAVAGLATLPLTVKSLRFDPLKDLPPVISMVEGAYIFGSSAKYPWKNFSEFVANAKANPGKLNYGASSTAVRLLSEALIRGAGLNIVYIPYKEGGAYISSVGAGEVQMGFMSEGSAIGLGERFRALAVTGAARRASYRDAPTFAELGHPEIRGVAYSLNVAAGTPRPMIERLNAAAAQALQQPEVKAQYAKMRLDVVGGSPEDAARALAGMARTYAEIAKSVGIQAE
jgi:tripartite-type tricarboxylate transporter receptor subunit TctC